MALFRKKKQLTRREIIAQRRSIAASEDQTIDTGTFRRSRTLSSLHHPEQPSERQAAWDLRKRRRRLLSWLGGSLLGLGAVIFLLSQLSATVVVTGPDGQKPAYEPYGELLSEYFGTRPLERLRFMVDQSTLQSFFIERAPELQSVRIVGGDAIGQGVLQVSFRQPIIQWSSGGGR